VPLLLLHVLKFIPGRNTGVLRALRTVCLDILIACDSALCDFWYAAL